MRRHLLVPLLSLALGSSLLLGCKGTGTKPSYSGDPLLKSKKPLLGKFDPRKKAPPSMMASADPLPPPDPVTAIATGPTKNDPGPLLPSPPPPATVSAPRPAPGVVAATQARPVSPGSMPFDHAPDYSWLQGVLEKHYRGYWCLRYCDAQVEDRWGGKVVLEDDPRLNRFQEGDLVRVQGQIITGVQPASGTWDRNPRFRIQDITFLMAAK